MIFWFSGTGNSRLVAKRLSDKLGEPMLEINALTLAHCHVTDAERIVWVFPIYSWGVPPVVRRFMGMVQLDCDVPHHMVCSCGDDIGLANAMWRGDLAARGWKGVSSHSVQMPNNYVSLPGFDVDSPRVEQSKLDAAVARIDAVARDIAGGRCIDDVVPGSIAWIKTKVIYPLFVKYEMNPGRFKATDACVGCSKCARICPLNNIEMKHSRPEWGRECAMCLACYHVCPNHAVAYGKRTEGKGQYMAPSDL